MEQGNQVIQLYDDFAARHNAAYAAFETIYAAKNPKPILTEVKKDVVGVVLGIVLSIVMAASVIVSSSRTIDEFGGGAIGAIAFVMIEGGIMAYAFWRARRTINIKKVENALRLATVGLVLTFIVGLSANIDATLRHKDIHLPDWVNTGINLLVAVSAPALAFISSEVLAIELMANDVRRRQNLKDHEAAMRAWKDDKDVAWVREKANWGVKIKVDNMVTSNTLSNGIPLESSGSLPAKSTLGHTKKPDAAKRVKDYLDENPDAINGNPLEIAAFLEVGKSTVYNVLKEYKANK